MIKYSIKFKGKTNVQAYRGIIGQFTVFLKVYFIILKQFLAKKVFKFDKII